MVTGDGVQNVIPQNIVPGHTEYFKLTEFENMAEAWRSLRPSPTILPEAGHKTLRWEMLSLNPEEKNICISRHRGTQEVSQKEDPANPPVTTSLIFPDPLHPPQLPAFTTLSIKVLGSVSSGAHVLVEAPVSRET